MQIEALVPLLEVADIGRSLGFYRRLGFEAETTYERHGATLRALLRNGAQRLLLQQRQGGAGAAGTTLCLHVASAEEARAALAAAGLTPPPVARLDYGLEGFMLHDADGHTIAVVSEPMRLA